MGLFDSLFGRKKDQEEADSVWLTGAAKLAGMCARAERHAKERQVILLAHFPRTLEAVAEAQRGRTGLENARRQGDVTSALSAPQAGSVCLALVGQLPAIPPSVIGQATTVVSFLVAERHPLRAEDDRVEQLAAGLPYPCQIRFHLSLDDPLLEPFAGERFTTLVAQLGVGEEEELSHPMITSAVERTQKKLAEKGISGVEAQSVEEWMRAVEPE